MGGLFVSAVDADDDDDVVVALETARVSEERRDFEATAKWLQRAAAAARQQGRSKRAGQLSRRAAQALKRSAKFERKTDEAQVLKDIDDHDFSDETIVETAAEIARKAAEQPAEGVHPVVQKPTPIAPLASQPKAPSHHAIRVAVKKTLGGNFEARPLHDGESPLDGEQEALLVPVRGGSKLV